MAPGAAPPLGCWKSPRGFIWAPNQPKLNDPGWPGRVAAALWRCLSSKRKKKRGGGEGSRQEPGAAPLLLPHRPRSLATRLPPQLRALRQGPPGNLPCPGVPWASPTPKDDVRTFSSLEIEYIVWARQYHGVVLSTDTLKLQLLLGSTHLSHLRNGSAEYGQILTAVGGGGPIRGFPPPLLALPRRRVTHCVGKLCGQAGEPTGCASWRSCVQSHFPK
jgi:hypothetical protein